ncbi:MAG: cupin domain-containing protein [Rhodocyclaceae bacterium]
MAAEQPEGKPRIVFNAGTLEYLFEEGCFITEWWNSPDDDAMSVARARVPAGATTAWHVLDGIAERYVILQGSGRAEVGRLPPMPVGVGDVVVIPPGVRQRIHADTQHDLIFLALCTPRFMPAAYRPLSDDY